MGAFDIQVNGFAGVDFNADHLGDEEFSKVDAALDDCGVSGILATVITADLKQMERRIQRLAQAPSTKIEGVHIEGPFLNPAPGYIGAHPTEHAKQASVDDMKRLIDAGGGKVKLVTLAPEQDADLKVTKWLVAQGITVAAGHCDPSMDELTAAADAGLSMFTHLGNGCPPQIHRHDNIIQRVLSLSDRLWICLIADGHHLPLFVLKNMIAVAGVERCIATTDAMAAANAAPGIYPLAGQQYEVGEDRVVRVPGTDQFAGSAATLVDLQRTLGEIGLSENEVQQLVESNPRSALARRN